MTTNHNHGQDRGTMTKSLTMLNLSEAYYMIEEYVHRNGPITIRYGVTSLRYCHAVDRSTHTRHESKL